MDSDTLMEGDKVVAGPSKTASRFDLNEIVEALDRTDCSQFRYARVFQIVGGRIQVLYFDAADDDSGFWFSENSDQVHKVGWCRVVGASLAPGLQQLPWPKPSRSEFKCNPTEIELALNMVFEMRHPCLPYKIVAGTVIEVYNRGYFLAETDQTKPDEIVHFVLHVTSDYILPINFCHDHGIQWDPPKFEDGSNFTWKKWLALSSDLKPMSLGALAEEKAKKNTYQVGDKIEVPMVTSPCKIRPATVVEVAGHLIKVKILGSSDWQGEQWMSCESTNIYPVGYSENLPSYMKTKKKGENRY